MVIRNRTQINARQLLLARSRHRRTDSQEKHKKLSSSKKIGGSLIETRFVASHYFNFKSTKERE